MNQHRARALGLVIAFTALAIALGDSTRRLSAQDSARPTATEDERANRLGEMQHIVRSFQVVAIDDHGKQLPAIKAQEPLHSWTDPTRHFSDGALWIFKQSGRPVAVIGIELYNRWSLEFVSLSTGLVQAENGQLQWTPRKPGIEFQEIPKAPAPAAGAAERLRQMRDLAKQFTAREHWVTGNGQHYVLRLLPHPIDRYGDAASETLDGALFVFANGTNPEILLLIEARRHGDGPARWSFAAAPLSRAEVALKLGSRDVWTSPSKDSERTFNPENPYYVGYMPRRSPTGDKPRTTGEKAAPR
jgi:hypothetical protein